MSLLEFNEDNANIRDVIAPQNRTLTGKRGSNKSTINSKGKKSITDEGKYEDDLAFLNKFNQDKVLRMSSSFKNPGRGWVSKQKEI